MKIQYIPINDLKPSEYNPRSWDEKSIQDLKKSIKRFGMVDPLIVNSAEKRKNIVIGGHFRLKVAKDMGLKEVPVVYVDIPDQEKEKELNLRLNKNLGAWDVELLKTFDTNFLLDVGFSPDELDGLFEDMLEVNDDEFDVQKELEKIEAPNTKQGELYKLGDHYLLCGDALSKADVKLLMGKEKADMIYCDPPYNIGLDYFKGVSTQGKYSPSEIVKDRKTPDQYRGFLNTSIKNALSVSKPDAHVFYWCDEKYVWLLQELYRENGINNKRVCLWIKNNIDPTPQYAFNKVIEMCVYGTRGKPRLNQTLKNLNEILNKEINSVGILDDIMTLIQMWLVKRDNTTDYEHPTQKPITLNEKPIKRCTSQGDIVLDLFGGSGSTLIACEQLKRRAFVMELDPIFCDVIIKRFEHHARTNAIKLN